ncbi:TolC family protein [Catenovulum sediminis]|uniref:TolC family protein n=1 Tax=Catenovulum sediminis TaxID=1740262 RepID=A0ABV1RJ03_9ALTE
MEFCKSTLVFLSIISQCLLSSTLEAEERESISIYQAIELSLHNNAQLNIQDKEREFAFQNVQVSESEFDILVSGDVRYVKEKAPVPASPAIDQVDRQSDTHTFGIRKKVKLGATLAVELSTSGITEDYGLIGKDTSATTNLGVTLSVPLWKGRGKDNFIADVAIAQLNHAASQASYRDVKAMLILNTLSRYWVYRGALDSLTLLGESVERNNTLLARIEKLINNGERPRADYGVVSALVSSRMATYLSGERNLVLAKLQLSEIIGVPVTIALDKDIPSTALYSPVEDLLQIDLAATGKLTKSLVNKRADYRSIKKMTSVAAKRVMQAKDNAKPELNFYVNANTTRLGEHHSHVSALTGEDYGPNWQVGLEFKWYPAETLSKANVEKAQILYQQQQYAQHDLYRAITMNIQAALFKVNQSIKQYKETVNREVISRKNVDNEIRKLLSGDSTILDVTNIEESLVSASLERVKALVEYNQNLSILLYELGLLDLNHSNIKDELMSLLNGQALPQWFAKHTN